MKVQLKYAKPASEIQLSDAAFGRDYNEALVLDAEVLAEWRMEQHYRQIKAMEEGRR